MYYLSQQAVEISNIKSKQNVLEKLCLQIIIQMDWTMNFNFEKKSIMKPHSQ